MYFFRTYSITNCNNFTHLSLIITFCHVATLVMFLGQHGCYSFTSSFTLFVKTFLKIFSVTGDIFRNHAAAGSKLD
jgi:hypothetical protein